MVYSEYGRCGVLGRGAEGRQNGPGPGGAAFVWQTGAGAGIKATPMKISFLTGVRPEARRLGVVVVLCVLAWLFLAPLARGGRVEDRDGKTIIHVKLWWLPDPGATDAVSRADVAAVKEFKRRFPQIFAEKYRDKYKADPERYGRHNWDNVEVELHRFSGISVEGIEQDLLAIAGRVAPDVLYVNFRRSDNFIRSGFLYPLDKPEDGYFSSMTDEEQDFRIHPKIWPVIRRRGPDGQRHIWAIPYGGALGKVMLYRKDLFERAGVPYPTNDWTWDDMLEACRKVSDPERGVYGIGIEMSKYESWNWITFLWSAGGEVMTYDEAEDKWTCAFDTREAAVALDFYTRLWTEPWTDKSGIKHRGYVCSDVNHWVQWNNGKIALSGDYVDEKVLTHINPDITGMVPVPVGPTGGRGGELNSRMMGLFAGITDPAVRDAGWEYMRFYDSKDAVALKTKILVEGGLGRFVNPRYLEMFGYGQLVRLAPKEWLECFKIAIDTGKPEPYGKNSNFAYGMMTIPIVKARNAALAGNLPADREKRLDVLQGFLREGVALANKRMLGEVPPKERTWRSVTAVAMLAAMAVAFVWMFLRVARIFSPPAVAGMQRQGWRFRKYAVAYMLLLPAVLSIVVWQYVPLIRGSVMAFQDYNVMGGSTWVGVDNFGDILWDAEWWAAVWNSFRYSFLVIALTFLPPVVLAILLQEVPRGKILFRTIYYLPAVITGLVTILLWKQFYEPSRFGVLNAVLMNVPAVVYPVAGLILVAIALAFERRLMYHGHWVVATCFAAVGVILFYTCCGLARPILAQEGVSIWQMFRGTLAEPYNWLNNPDTAMFGCVLPMVWAGMGPGCLIYLAALKGIPDDAYEAADIDGATFVDKILFVVFPMLKALIIINFVGVFIGSWNATGNILAMTGGAADTEVAGLSIFYRAFAYLKFGPATAMAWMLGFMLIGFTVHQLRILSRLEFKTTGDRT